MIFSEKVRAMDKPQKFQYFLRRMVSTELGENAQHDAITVISDLMKETPLDKIAETFGVNVAFDMHHTPAQITITIPNEEQEYVFDMAVVDRDQFADATPEKEKRPIKSFLTEEEKQELVENAESTMTVSK